MSESIRLRIEEPSQTSEARRIGRRLAARMDFDETLTEQVAIVVTEACTNLLKHGGEGELLLRTTDDDSSAGSLELLALDKGVGMTNLEQCLQDGFSTGGSPGQGLGAISRLSSASDFFTEGGRGTAVLARWALPTPRFSTSPEKPLPLQLGAVNASKPGQEVCGDSWGAEQTEEYSTILVADGLGHGLDAKTASTEAVRMLHEAPHLSPGALLERVHQALRSTRGAAVAAARIDHHRNKVTFSGIGNISAQIFSGRGTSQSMVSVYGTAGFQTAKIREFEYAWPDQAVLLMYSDGLGSQTSPVNYPGLILRDPTLVAGVLYRDFVRGNDDATIVIGKAA